MTIDDQATDPVQDADDDDDDDTDDEDTGESVA
jgi:hypothetical protein